MANKIIDIQSKTGGKAGKANILNYEVLIDKYKPLRSPKLNVKNIFSATNVNRLPEYIIQVYNLRGLEFGNWVNQVRRLDYCLSTIIAFYDLNKVIGFDNNIGINKALTFAYGARGSRGALAHYEPLSRIVNLSRDRRIDKLTKPFSNEKLAVFESTTLEDWINLTNLIRKNKSGYGAIAHEYGHALDYILAENYTTRRSTALSGGGVILPNYKSQVAPIISAHLTNNKNNLNDLETAFIKAFKPILIDDKDRPTGFYRRLYDFAKKNDNTYFIQLNEIWARVFETYIAYRLSKQGVKNEYLVAGGKGKYRNEIKNGYSYIYPTYGEIAKNEKNIKNFLQIASMYINS